MAKRRFKFTITDAEALKAAYPNAVTITQRTITDVEANYKVIAALLEAGIEVPGIQITNAQEVQQGDVIPEFLKKPQEAA